MRLTDMKDFSQSRFGYPLCMKFPNALYVFSRKAGLVIALPKQTTPLAYHIPRIVSFSAKKYVAWVYTWAIITTMQAAKVVWDRAVRDFLFCCANIFSHLENLLNRDFWVPRGQTLQRRDRTFFNYYSILSEA